MQVNEESKGELINRFRKTEREVGLAAKDFAGLEKKLLQSHEALKQAQANLTGAEQSQRSPN